MDMEDIMGENGSIILLQVLIIILAVIIMILLYSERSTTDSMSKKIDNFKCPDPAPCPDCPDCNCTKEGCPDCVCPKSNKCPTCPSCPDCPKSKTLTPEDIADAIFPGRNKGITMHGKYYPLSGLDEKHVLPAFTESNVGGSNYAPVTFDTSVALASKKSPPIDAGTGVFTPAPTSGVSPPIPKVTPPTTDTLP